MKTSAVLASVLFGSFAVAAPFDKRAIAYHTEVVTETVVVYTTIYGDEPVAPATSEKAHKPTSAVVAPTSAAAPAYTASPVAEKPTIVNTPAQTPKSTPTPEVQQSKEEPKPTTTKQAPAPVVSSAAPVVESAAPKIQDKATTSGQTYTDAQGTIYLPNGGTGACGLPIANTDMVVALSRGTWGTSTHDVMTGKSSNPWCGQKIKIDYNGKSIEATIQDMCPDCVTPVDIDLSPAAWKELTGLEEYTRVKGMSWSKIA